MQFDLEEGNATPQLKDMRVKQAMRLIDLRLNDAQLTVGQLAKTLGQSERRLRQIFMKEFGVGPKQYIRERRLARAATLLADSALSVKEVMSAIGFNHPSHFSREYKRFFGETPSESRDRLDSRCSGSSSAPAEIINKLPILSTESD